jgi:hypothetical protein
LSVDRREFALGSSLQVPAAGGVRDERITENPFSGTGSRSRIADILALHSKDTIINDGNELEVVDWGDFGDPAHFTGTVSGVSEEQDQGDGQ